MKALLRIRVLVAQLWSAVTCHRFVCLADSSAKQRRVERCAELPARNLLGGIARITTLGGDKSPAKSAAKSAHSKAPGAQRFIVVTAQVWLALKTCLSPRPPWRRYRVTPRANPVAFRDQLLRGIQRELQRAGIAGSRGIVGRVTL